MEIRLIIDYAPFTKLSSICLVQLTLHFYCLGWARSKGNFIKNVFLCTFMIMSGKSVITRHVSRSIGNCTEQIICCKFHLTYHSGAAMICWLHHKNGGKTYYNELWATSCLKKNIFWQNTWTLLNDHQNLIFFLLSINLIL